MSTETLNPNTEAVKAELMRAKDRLAKNLATTPDDKLHWSPSETARTPLMQVAHGAHSLTGMQAWFEGKFPADMDIEAMDRQWREEEKLVKSREEALDLLEQKTNTYAAYLDSLTDEQLAASFETPFGPFPMSEAITWPADHLRGHAAQLEYMQTIYGDLSWHMD